MEINNVEIFKRGLENLRKNSKKVVLAATSFALLTSLTACGPTNEQKTEEKDDVTTSQEAPKEESQDTRTESEKEADTKVGKAMEVMKEGFDKLSESASDAANSEATQENLNNSFKEFDDLTGFLFNGEELGGVKFDDLSESGKENVLNFFNSIDSKVDEWVPNYKERFKDWTIRTGAKGLDLLNKAKDKLQEWTGEVEEEYNKTYTK